MSRRPTSREEIVRELAPPAPPCFESAEQWRQVLVSAAEAQHYRPGTVGPLLLQRGRPVTFNPAFDFCGDCLPSYAQAMSRQGRCHPRHLTENKDAHEPRTA